jgi:predicted metal-binding protein
MPSKLAETAMTTIFVCVTCRREEEPLEPKEGRSGYKMRLALIEAIEKGKPAGIELKPVECLSGCKRGCTVALAAPGKWSYVVADLDPARHAPDILTFAAQYTAHPEGVPVWRERPEIVRRSVLARVPPASPPVKPEEKAA